ncbi:MAG: MFS transporter [Xanthomonadales bacterium]|jgi:predicted MFS family arabinose efflux permease|nr:MFS transporter [Xanthomonadales bacterium]
MNIPDRFPKVSPNSIVARLFLAFLATAGLFYVNIMPTIVSGLIEALQYSNQQAGYVASANMYGAAFGALLIVMFVRRIKWKPLAFLLLVTLISIDLASIYLSSPAVLISVRFVHGFVGGMLVGTGFSVMARTKEPDRSFGMLLVVQFGLGGVGVMFIPGLVPWFGTAVLFLSLIAFSIVTLLMLPFLPSYHVDKEEREKRAAAHNGVRKMPLALTLGSIFLFQAANMGLYAYIIGLGEFYGLELSFITGTLGVAAWLGLAGAGLVVVISDRFGYLRSLGAGILLTVIGTWGFLYSDVHWVWVTANCLIGITWAYTIAYLLGLMSRFDSTGQMAALGGFASKMGLASGPAICAVLLGSDNYPLIIIVAAIALTISFLAVVLPALVQDRGAS